MAHDRVGSSADPTLNGHLKYPNNLDQSLNDEVADKIRKCRADYNNRPPSVVSFMTAIGSTSGRLHSEFVRLLFLQTHRETDRFFTVSGVQSAQTQRGISTTNPVCGRLVNLLVCSLPLHRHSFIGFIFSFRFIDS
jgi:hypothetical protein